MQKPDFSKAARILLCGGRHGAQHIATHLDCCEGKYHTLVLDASAENAQSYLSANIGTNQNYAYYHLPGQDFYGRINIIAPSLAQYDYISLVAVDDLVLDSSILEAVSTPFSHTTILYGNPLVKGFGPDMSYVPRNSNGPGYFFSMPRQSPVNGSLIPSGTYWERLRVSLMDKEPASRLFGLICKAGFFPFVYSTFFANSFLALIKCHLEALSKSCIPRSSCKDSILFEFIIVAAGSLASPISVIKDIYRLNNYVCNSAGANSTYNHRSLIGNTLDNEETLSYFQYMGSLLSEHLGLGNDPSLLLHAAYQCLSIHSYNMLNLSVSTASSLHPRSPYQRESMIELLHGENTTARLNRFIRMLDKWEE